MTFWNGSFFFFKGVFFVELFSMQRSLLKPFRHTLSSFADICLHQSLLCISSIAVVKWIKACWFCLAQTLLAPLTWRLCSPTVSSMRRVSTQGHITQLDWHFKPQRQDFSLAAARASVWRLAPLIDVLVIVMWPVGEFQDQSAAGLPRLLCLSSLTLEC